MFAKHTIYQSNTFLTDIQTTDPMFCFLSLKHQFEVFIDHSQSKCQLLVHSYKQHLPLHLCLLFHDNEPFICHVLEYNNNLLALYFRRSILTFALSFFQYH